MPEPTYRVSEVLRLTGLTVRAIRHYVQMRLVQGAPARGPATVYSHEQLVRLQVIALLRRHDRLSLPKIRHRLAGLDVARLQAMLPAPTPPPPPSVATPPAIAPGAQRWDRVALLPGLELSVRADAGPIVHRLAREIAASYGSERAIEPEPERTADR